MAAQISVKLAMLVGSVGAVKHEEVSTTCYLISPMPQQERPDFASRRAKNLRGAQSRSARPSTSVAQQTGLLLPLQTRAACLSTSILLPGMADATIVLAPAARATTTVEKRMTETVHKKVVWTGGGLLREALILT